MLRRRDGEASSNAGTRVSSVAGLQLHFVNGGENIPQSIEYACSRQFIICPQKVHFTTVSVPHTLPAPTHPLQPRQEETPGLSPGF